MIIYNNRQAMTRQYGRGIGKVFRDIRNSNLFKGTVRGARKLSNFLGNQFGDEIDQSTKKAVSKIGNVLGNKAEDSLNEAFDRGVSLVNNASTGSTIGNTVLNNIQRELNKPDTRDKFRMKTSDLGRHITNVVNEQGEALPNASEILKNPDVIKTIPTQVFKGKPKKGKGANKESLSELLEKSASRRGRPGYATQVRQAGSGIVRI